MTEAAFLPTVFLKPGCPFCLKLRILLLEAGIIDQVALVENVPPETLRQLIAHTGKASFPSAEIAPGTYLVGTDALLDHFSAIAGVVPGTLATFQAYATGVMPKLHDLYRENMELKQQLSAQV